MWYGWCDGSSRKSVEHVHSLLITPDKIKEGLKYLRTLPEEERHHFKGQIIKTCQLVIDSVQNVDNEEAETLLNAIPIHKRTEYPILNFQAKTEDVGELMHPSDDIFVFNIVPLLAPKDIWKLCCLNKHWHSVLSSNAIWKPLVLQDFEMDEISSFYNYPQHLLWKGIYAEIGAYPSIGALLRVQSLERYFVGRVVSKLDRDKFCLFLYSDSGTMWNNDLIWIDRKKDAALLTDINLKEENLSQFTLDIFESKQKLVVTTLANGISYWVKPYQFARSTLSMYPTDNEISIKISETKCFTAIQVCPKKFELHCPVLVNPEVGGLLEVLDTVRKWYAAIIIAVEAKGYIRISYEGWDERWDEAIHIRRGANRLRKFVPDRAQVGERKPKSDWSALKIMEFV